MGKEQKVDLMVQNWLVILHMVKLMDKGQWFTQTVMYTLETSQMAKHMDTENILKNLEKSTKANGNKTNQMVKEKKFLKMAHFMKVILKMVPKMVLELISGQISRNIQDILVIMNLMDTEFLSGVMVTNTKELGNII